MAVVLDNDAKFPGHRPNADIIDEAGQYAAFMHQLRKRSIESYIPLPKLRRFATNQQFAQKFAALEGLSDTQRQHFHMKRGFRYNKAVEPTKDNYMSAGEVSSEEKELYRTLANDRWASLMHGMGNGLAAIYTDINHRPTSKDPELTSSDDKAELESLIRTLYSRI